MTLLELEHVSKRYRRGTREQVVLDDVSLEVDPGEYLVVWGQRRSGRSTLLRVAAGIEAPERGAVRYQQQDLRDHGERFLGEGIGFCQRRLHGAESRSVLDATLAALLANGIPPATARNRARDALERSGLEHCARLSTEQLDSGEATRVMIARALALDPRLLIVDEPTSGVEISERDGILGLLRSLADDGIAVLAATGEAAGLSGADRTLTIGDGQLRGAVAPELAPVVPLRSPAGRRAAG